MGVLSVTLGIFPEVIQLFHDVINDLRHIHAYSQKLFINVHDHDLINLHAPTWRMSKDLQEFPLNLDGKAMVSWATIPVIQQTQGYSPTTKGLWVEYMTHQLMPTSQPICICYHIKAGLVWNCQRSGCVWKCCVIPPSLSILHGKYDRWSICTSRLVDLVG